MLVESESRAHNHSDAWGRAYARIDILTIEGLLNDPGRPHPGCLRVPPRTLSDTFKQAPKHKTRGDKQLDL